MSDEINYPTGFSLKDIVSWGSSGMICLDKPSQTIVKSPHGEENKDDIAIEKRIYERFSEHGGHEGLLYYHGPYESGIRLEFACNGNLRSFLKKRAKDIDIERRLRWANRLVVKPLSRRGIDAGIPGVTSLLTLVVPFLQDNMLGGLPAFAIFFAVFDIVAHCLVWIWRWSWISVLRV